MQGSGFRMQGLGSIGLRDSHVGLRCRVMKLRYLGF